MREASAVQLCFGALRAMLLAYVPPLEISDDLPAEFELVTPRADALGEKLAFARLTLTDTDVRLQLMAIARSKSPADLFSPALNARQRGLQLFSFDAPDAALFEDVARVFAECIAICRLRKLL